MSRISTAIACLSLLACAAASGCATSAREVSYSEGRKAQVTADGLHRIDARGATTNVFVRPATDLKPYTQVILDPVRIRYSRGSTRHLDDEIMRRRAEGFRGAFVKELEKNTVYTLVTAPGAHVLRIAPQVVDLTVTAPRDPSPSSRRTVLVDSAGAMTLVLDISDSRSHAPLVRVGSRQVVSNPTSTGYEANPAKNLSDARIVFRHWAKLLRKWLDDVREIPPVPGSAPPASS